MLLANSRTLKDKDVIFNVIVIAVINVDVVCIFCWFSVVASIGGIGGIGIYPLLLCPKQLDAIAELEQHPFVVLAIL